VKQSGKILPAGKIGESRKISDSVRTPHGHMMLSAARDKTVLNNPDAVTNGRGSKHKWRLFSLLLLWVVLGVFIRTAAYRNFINPAGGFYFYNVDSYDHLRRVTLGVRSFPHVPVFDSYAGYPQGMGQIWSPLYDYLLSAICVLLGGSKVTIETVCFFANPFYAALTVVLLFFVARSAFASDVAGLAAAFLLALNPGHISGSIPMNFGHHVFEPLTILLLFCLPLFEEGDRLIIKGKMLAAFFLVLAIFMWRGSTVYWGIAFLSVFIRVVVSGQRKLSLDYAAAFAGAAAAIAAFCAANPWGSDGGFNFAVVSWFHVIVLGIGAGILALYGTVRERKDFFYYAAAACVAVFAAVFFLQTAEKMFSEIATGVIFLRGGGDPWLESNAEMHGVFSKHNFLFSAGYLTAAWFAVPVAAVLAFLKWNRDGRKDRYLITFVVWSPVMLLGLVIRYTVIASVISSLSGGYLFALAWERWKGGRRRAATIVLAAVLIIPSWPHYAITLADDLPPHIKYGLLGRNGVLEWMRDNTPKTSYYFKPDKRPEYGVLAGWDLGAQIYQVAERPAMSTAFGWEVHGFYEENAFMTTPSQEAALAIVRQNGIRYVMLNAFGKFQSMYAIALDGERKGRLSPGTAGAGDPNRSIYERLMYYDGAAHVTRSGAVHALGNYRLLFETRYRGESPYRGAVSYYKVFEVVPGATVIGRAKANSEVSINLPLLTSANRITYFQDMTTADSGGTFRFVVPYATNAVQGWTTPLGAYTVSVGGTQPQRMTVTEGDVMAGRTIPLR
jgi:asparagine N-glycosylation enzyme membrane subunit Stt3